jgi:hypothetical protein
MPPKSILILIKHSKSTPSGGHDIELKDDELSEDKELELELDEVELLEDTL